MRCYKIFRFPAMMDLIPGISSSLLERNGFDWRTVFAIQHCFHQNLPFHKGIWCRVFFFFPGRRNLLLSSIYMYITLIVEAGGAFFPQERLLRFLLRFNAREADNDRGRDAGSAGFYRGNRRYEDILQEHPRNETNFPEKKTMGKRA